MKKTITTITGMALLFASCSKSGSGGTSTPSIILSPEEKLLVGHWQLKKVTDSTGMIGAISAKSETNYDVTDFIELNNKREYSKTLDEKFKDARIGGVGAALGGTNSGSKGIIQDYVSWYYDDGALKLVLSSIPYTVISVSSSELVLWRNPLTGSFYTSYTSVYSK